MNVYFIFRLYKCCVYLTEGTRRRMNWKYSHEGFISLQSWPAWRDYDGISKSFRTESIMKYYSLLAPSKG